MTSFSDLSLNGDNPPARNIGWLQRGHVFEQAVPSKETLDLLWRYCEVKVRQMRGFHQCDFCVKDQIAEGHPVVISENGLKLWLGSAEIRAFSEGPVASGLAKPVRENRSGGLLFLESSIVPFNVFAAPNLIYHYVSVHHYCPPEEFLSALRDGPQPPSEEYFQRLRQIGLQWEMASGPQV